MFRELGDRSEEITQIKWDKGNIEDTETWKIE